MGKKMRITLPKREEDIEKIMNEVLERHPEMAHEHHHREHDVQDLVNTIEVLFDVAHTRLSYVENDVKLLAKHTALLYKLVLLLAKGLVAEDREEKRKTLEEIVSLLEEHVRRLQGENIG